MLDPGLAELSPEKEQERGCPGNCSSRTEVSPGLAWQWSLCCTQCPVRESLHHPWSSNGMRRLDLGLTLGYGMAAQLPFIPDSFLHMTLNAFLTNQSKHPTPWK